MEAEVPSVSSIYLWPAVERLHAQSAPRPGEWWWVFAPWLHELLGGGRESLAYFVCLGYHIGPITSPKRKWLHFLPDGISPQSRDIQQLRQFIGYNVQFAREARKKILLTTQLLESIDRADSELEPRERPRLRPLLISFGSSEHADSEALALPGSRLVHFVHQKHGTISSSPLRCVNWEKLRKYIVNPSMSSRRVTIESSREGPNPQQEIISLDDGSAPVLHKTGYFDQLAANAGGFVIPNSEQLSDLLLGPSNNSAALADLHKCFESDHGPDYLEKLCRYGLWIHDVASHEKWSYVYTIPFWLPPIEDGARDGSAIVYLRSNSLERAQIQIPDGASKDANHNAQAVAWLLGCAAAVQSGSGFMAYDRYRGTTRVMHGQLGDAIRCAEAQVAANPSAAGVLVQAGSAAWYAYMKEGLEKPAIDLVPCCNLIGWERIIFLIENTGTYYTPDEFSQAVNQQRRRGRASSYLRVIESALDEGLVASTNDEPATWRQQVGEKMKEHQPTIRSLICSDPVLQVLDKVRERTQQNSSNAIDEYDEIQEMLRQVADWQTLEARIESVGLQLTSNGQAEVKKKIETIQTSATTIVGTLSAEAIAPLAHQLIECFERVVHLISVGHAVAQIEVEREGDSQTDRRRPEQGIRRYLERLSRDYCGSAVVKALHDHLVAAFVRNRNATKWGYPNQASSLLIADILPPE